MKQKIFPAKTEECYVIKSFLTENPGFSPVPGVRMQIVISNSVLRERRTDISDV